MRLLLDTHTFVSWNEGELTARTRGIIETAGRVFVSAASGWETAIKTTLGKLRMRDAANIADVVASMDLPSCRSRFAMPTSSGRRRNITAIPSTDS